MASRRDEADRQRRARRRSRRDEIAARAAREWASGRADTMGDAIDGACETQTDVRCRPGEGRVRMHLRAISESTLGREGHLRRSAEILGHALAAMELLEAAPLHAQTSLAGRAAQGHLEGDVVLHLRAVTDRPIGLIAAILVRAGFDEPEFDSFEARTGSVGCGRLHRLLTARDGVPISVVRCPPSQVVPGRRDLVRGTPVATLDFQDLAARVARLARGEDPF